MDFTLVIRLSSKLLNLPHANYKVVTLHAKFTDEHTTNHKSAFNAIDVASQKV